jgi:hypothetical protein
VPADSGYDRQPSGSPICSLPTPETTKCGLGDNKALAESQPGRAGCSTRPMLPFVTAGAQGNQVRVVIVAPLAAELLVMDLQVLPGTTNLASPAVAAKHLFSELFV